MTNDPIDDLLTVAGERWRAAQPPPPEPDASRWVTPARRGWLVPAGAAAATVLAAGAMVFATQRTPADPVLEVSPDPAVSTMPVVPTSSAVPSRPAETDEPASLIVRDGDLVEVSGRVKDGELCAPAPIGGDSCPYDIDVPGVPPSDGVTLRARWHRDGLSDIEVLPYAPTSAGAGWLASPLPQTPPCSAPPGGWSEKKDWGTPEVEDPLRNYLHEHADQFAEQYVTHLNGARIMVVTVVKGDVEKARKALEAIYTANLCVVGAPGERSLAADEELQATVGAATRDLMGDNISGVYMARQEEDRIRVNMVQLTEPLYERLVAIGLDRQIIDPWIRPVTR
ncbi:hypothetical protein [Actinoplanes sp. NPDC026670]|uniref:hypothetical protein n=1 Tax=Actinoplanes sp. NPDC026670 TaxID=3154700 RepID=UPI0033C3F0CE